MKTLQIIAIIALMLPCIVLAQEQTSRQKLSEHEDNFRVNNKNYEPRMLKAGLNSHKELDSMLLYIYYEGDSVRDRKWEFSFDEMDNKTMQANYVWDLENNKWQAYGANFCFPDGCGKHEYIFDSAGRILAHITFSWSDEWYASGKIEYNYNEEGKLSLYTVYDWDYVHNDWRQSEYCVYRYDDSGILSWKNEYEWDFEQNEWVRHERIEYNYDGDERSTIETYYHWDTIQRDWTYHSQYEYSYDTSGYQTQKIYSRWNSDQNDWKPNSKIESNYDDGRLVLEMNYHYSGLNHWEAENKTEYSYNDEGKMILELHYHNGGRWRITDKIERNYDTDNDITMIVTSGLIEGNLEVLMKHFYHYSSPATGIDHLTDDEVILFPNPTSGIINITGLTQRAEVKMYSIQGQLMKSFTQVEDLINVSDLKSGIYILQLSTNNGNLVRRIVIEK